MWTSQNLAQNEGKSTQLAQSNSSASNTSGSTETKPMNFILKKLHFNSQSAVQNSNDLHKFPHQSQNVTQLTTLPISPNQLPPTAANIPLSYQNPSNYSFSTQRTPISYKPQSANLNLASSGSAMQKNEFQNTVHDFQNTANFRNPNFQNSNFQTPNPQNPTHKTSTLQNTYLSSSTESSSFTNFPYPPHPQKRINQTATSNNEAFWARI